MSDFDEIDGLFRDIESDRVERKRGFKSSRDDIRKAICAFANDLPNHRAAGVVFVGQNDDGTCAELLFGKDPRYFFPGAYIQFLRVDGQELTDRIRDQKELAGTVVDQIRQIEELVRLNVSTEVTMGGPARRQDPDYPLTALEQLVRNAVLHRN